MKKAFWFLVVIFLVNLVGLYFRWYLKYSWFDQILHFSGGFFVAMFFSVYLKDNLHGNTKIKNILIVVGVTALIGVLWEFTEYLASMTLIHPIYTHFHVRAYFIGDLEDTLNDILMDILGACFFAGAVLHPLWRRETHKA